ncbi:MAG TPA: 50S ribosomal protein L29 [Gemmatimonadales bacterium]|nr:50S ribosomal protein L29 [Gemmatimonadales bacterium]
MALTKLTPVQIRELTDAELKAKLAEYEKEFFGLRFKAATEVLGNPMDLRTARRTVARLKTVLAERAAKAKAKTP